MPHPHWDLDALRTFLAVVDAGGFTAGGRRLARTQSAVSLSIRKLEQAAGTRLLLRGPRQLQLTPAGERLLAPARRLLEQSEVLLCQLREAQAEGELRLGLGELFIPEHLPRLLRQFVDSHPRIQLEVQVGLAANLWQQQQAGQLDLVLAHREPGMEGGRLVWSEPLRWLAGPGRQPILEPVLDLVVLPPACMYRQLAVRALNSAGRAWRIIMTSASLGGVEEAVLAGLGVAVLGRSSLQRRPGLRDVGQQLPPLPDCEIALFGESTHDSPAKQQLVKCLLTELGLLSSKA